MQISHGKPTPSPTHTHLAPPPPNPRIPSPSTNNVEQAAGGITYGTGCGTNAWWMPIRAVSNAITTSRSKSASYSGAEDVDELEEGFRAEGGQEIAPNPLPQDPEDVEMVPLSTRPQLRKLDSHGRLVWPHELEAVLIAGLRKYHPTTYRPRPSAYRNFNRNKLVSQYIKSVTGLERTPKQIASRIQVLRETWRDTKQFALVAQPRELSDMGYLPPLDDGKATSVPTKSHPAVHEFLSTEVGEPSPDPARKGRQTKKKKLKDSNPAADDAESTTLPTNLDASPNVGSLSARHVINQQQLLAPTAHVTSKAHLDSRERLLPSMVSEADDQTLRGPTHRQGIYVADETASLLPLTKKTIPCIVMINSQSLPAGRLPVIDPSDLRVLGEAVQVQELPSSLPDTAVAHLQQQLDRGQEVKTILVMDALPRSYVSFTSKGTFVEVENRIEIEISSASVQTAIDAFGESSIRQSKLGSGFHILQDSFMYTPESSMGTRVGTDMVKNATFVKTELKPCADGDIKHRFYLRPPSAAYDAMKGAGDYCIVVHSVSLLRKADSRQIDTFVVIWLIQSGPDKSTMRRSIVSLKRTEPEPTKPTHMVTRRSRRRQPFSPYERDGRLRSSTSVAHAAYVQEDPPSSGLLPTIAETGARVESPEVSLSDREVATGNGNQEQDPAPMPLIIDGLDSERPSALGENTGVDKDLQDAPNAAKPIVEKATRSVVLPTVSPAPPSQLPSTRPEKYTRALHVDYVDETVTNSPPTLWERTLSAAGVQPHQMAPLPAAIPAALENKSSSRPVPLDTVPTCALSSSCTGPPHLHVSTTFGNNPHSSVGHQTMTGSSIHATLPTPSSVSPYVATPTSGYPKEGESPGGHVYGWPSQSIRSGRDSLNVHHPTYVENNGASYAWAAMPPYSVQLTNPPINYAQPLYYEPHGAEGVEKRETTVIHQAVDDSYSTTLVPQHDWSSSSDVPALAVNVEPDTECSSPQNTEAFNESRRSSVASTWMFTPQHAPSLYQYAQQPQYRAFESLGQLVALSHTSPIDVHAPQYYHHPGILHHAVITTPATTSTVDTQAPDKITPVPTPSYSGQYLPLYAGAEYTVRHSYPEAPHYAEMNTYYPSNLATLDG